MKKKKLQFLLLSFAVFALVSCGGTSTTTSTSTAESSTTPISKWEYSTSVDEMTGDTTTRAKCISENAARFQFPFEGENYLSIKVRKTNNEHDILIEIDNGQFNSASVYGQTISVKFDEGKIIDVFCKGASDGSGNVLFIDKEKKFLPLLKDSKSMMIKVEFFQEGTRTFTFNTEGLVI
ncbi:MAG: hypothetical protein RR141_02335 [Rikenellaceae bacterium]